MAAKDDYAGNEILLRKSIKSKDIGSLYLFFGPEEYLIRKYTEFIEAIILPRDITLLNKVVLEGKVSASAIIDNCETLPVFSERKMVIVKNSGLFKGGGRADDQERKAAASGKKKRADDGLAGLLQNIPPHACLVFIEQEIDRRIKYVDMIAKYGLIVEFGFRRPDELTDWVMKWLKKMGHETDPRTAAMIVEYCEPGMDDIMNEMKKLCAYAGDRRKITAEDISTVCTRSVKSRVFDLTDAIASKQTSRALSLLRDMETLREPMPKIMYMIARQFRQLVQVKMMVGDGATQSQIASYFKIPPFIAGKLIKQAKSFSEEKLKKAINTGLELDLAIKTGKMSDKAAVEMMIASLSN